MYRRHFLYFLFYFFIVFGNAENVHCISAANERKKKKIQYTSSNFARSQFSVPRTLEHLVRCIAGLANKYSEDRGRKVCPLSALLYWAKLRASPVHAFNRSSGPWGLSREHLALPCPIWKITRGSNHGLLQGCGVEHG
jgi:hypothetical protein